MNLTVKKIPREFAQSIPKGMRLIKRQKNNFLLIESLFCPNGHNLIVDSVRIHNEASIKLKARINNSEGLLFVDAFWGSHAKLFSFIPEIRKKNITIEAFCPYCDVSLMEIYSCAESGCSSKNGILLHLPGGNNRIHVCARIGCPGHGFEINDIPHELIDPVNEINFFGAGSDDIFGGI